jgi:hypothetical protein
MDTFTEQHLERWLSQYEDHDQARIGNMIRKMVHDHPETITEMNLSWPEVRELAIRNDRLGVR